MSRRARGKGIVIVVRAIALIVTVAIVAGCPGAPLTGPTPSRSAAPSVEPEASADPLPVPAGAILASSAGAAAVAGVVGSWSLNGMVADAPWLPAEGLAMLEVPAGAGLSVAFEGMAGIRDWTARIAEASDRDGEGVRVLAEGNAGGDPAVQFDSPGPGDWVLAVTLTRADGRGRATYSWVVSVR